MEENQTQEKRTIRQLRRVPAVRRLIAIRCALNGAMAGVGLLLAALLPGLLLTVMVMALGGATLSPWLCVASAVLSLLAGAAGSWLVARHAKDAESSGLLVLGALLGLAGVLLLSFDGVLLQLCAGCALTGLGLGLCCAGAYRLTPVLQDVLRFLGEEAQWKELRQERALLALNSVTGAVLLGGAVLLVLRSRFRLALGLAALVCLAVLLVCALNCPVDRRYAHKLRRFLSREEEQKPLRKQLEGVLLEKHRRPWLILAIIAVLHRVYPHRVLGREHLRMDEDNPIVYLCNHGELYGPVAAMLYIPEYVRPWSISQIMVDPQETAEYLYRYNFGPARWLPGPLKWPVSRLVTRIAHWGLHALEAIPVFRDHPSQLRNTFRMAVEALQCGDPMLIFPENPNAVEQDHGYERSGVGTLFSGFAMLAPAYYNRTGKCCRFVPMYAHQGKRTVKFGEEIVFNPDNDPITERDRLVSEIGAQMNRLCAEMEGRA